MCLILDPTRNNGDEPLVAKKNIKCYKYLRPTENGGIAPFYEYKYTFGIENYTQMELEDIFVMKGFHAYQSRFKGLEIVLIHRPFEKYGLYKCIIPKGAKYYLGRYGEIVSDTMIVQSKYRITWFDEILHFGKKIINIFRFINKKK